MALLLFISHMVFAQTQGIGIGTQSPHPSAELDVSSSTRGLLPPRMTYAQITAIANPSPGLIIYCIDCLAGGQLLIYSGGDWLSLQMGSANGPVITAHICGAPDVHNPSKNYGSMTDQQGNFYRTILIGNQEWMAENLKTTIYRNGDTISNVTDANQWAGLTTGAWCSHDNTSQNDCPYGKLYNWYAVVDSRNLCPTGWHVPSDAEWTTLTDPLGSENIAGGKMKIIGTQYWLSPNNSSTNESGFSGLPGGYRVNDGSFDNFRAFGYWWSSTETNTTNALSRFLVYDMGNAFKDNFNKLSGFSVRCVRD